MSADRWDWCPVCQLDEEDEREQSLREDYEFGIDKNSKNFWIDYHARCSICERHWHFKYPGEGILNGEM